jgi:molybdopterin biosynthesis enzyme MoaB
VLSESNGKERAECRSLSGSGDLMRCLSEKYVTQADVNTRAVEGLRVGHVFISFGFR